MIASATCALPEIVEHGENGYLIPFENDAEVGRWPWIYRRRDPLYDEAYEAQITRMADSLTDILSEAYETRAGYGLNAARRRSSACRSPASTPRWHETSSSSTTSAAGTGSGSRLWLPATRPRGAPPTAEARVVGRRRRTAR